MLVLTRRVGESLRIGDEIEIRVLSTKGGSIRIGIQAPRDVEILREEVLARNKLELVGELRC